MNAAKQPAKRAVREVTSIQSPTNYEQLLKLMQLARIWIVKTDFARETECNTPSEYQMQIGRTQSDLDIHENYLCISLGFEIRGKNQESNIFTGHYHFAIVFEFTEHDLVESLLNIENIRRVFLGPQADKLVWPYLRRSLQQVLLDAGLPAVLLPLYR